ncbi:hypothetical protein SAMN05443669_100160 [Flavobacterium xanthum]|uniref:Uncharacterized protein n=1 Tax=Flavobacterium xanthum TaxID=69322 RepID=A0A1M6WWA3_9FLAO|nr:hypothetical protein SAMN05443669_100160 [Flavobacterium xanthum]
MFGSSDVASRIGGKAAGSNPATPTINPFCSSTEGIFLLPNN